MPATTQKGFPHAKVKNVTPYDLTQSPVRDNKMPLTRNLYELDEVVSALQTCLRKGWSRAHFWLWELLQSEEKVLADKTMHDLWLRIGGGHDPTLLTESDSLTLMGRVSAAIKEAKSLTAEKFLTQSAIQEKRPNMTLTAKSPEVAGRRAAGAKIFVTAVEEEGVEEAGNFWISLDSACRQGSRRDAFWLLQAAQHQFSADAIWTALKLMGRWSSTIELLRSQASPHPIEQLLHQSAALLILCTHGPEREVMLEPKKPDIRFERRTWASLTPGRRAARLNAIPVEALHANTTRGSMETKYTNIGDVRDPVALLTEGCAFWRRVTAAAGIVEDEETGAVEFPDDDRLEAFYQEYFPDDIPDEWSLADVTKSHGRGLGLTPVEEPPLMREMPVSHREWNIGTHVSMKKLKAPQAVVKR
jgi:hypothetical protein